MRRNPKPSAGLPLLGIVFAVPCITCVVHTARVAADAPAGITCDSLTVGLSNDKNYYIFTATASGDTGAVTGYTFDFGDHQSYSVVFGTTASQDRQAATVTHTYEEVGNYAVTAQVNTKTGDKKATVSSAACQASVTIGPPTGSLPSAGATDTITLFIISVFLSTLTYSLLLRYAVVYHGR